MQEERQQNIQEEIVRIYQELHQIPEIGLKEYLTTHYILNFIQPLHGITMIYPNQNVKQVDQLTGVVFSIAGNQITQPTFLFRADIDALPFPQESGVQYASKNGLHHACGHDAHTALLLMAAKSISEKRQLLKRKIIFCFQPGEEGHGGASKLLATIPKLLDEVDFCFAFHAGNYLETGTADIPLKYVTANSNSIKIQVFGQSAHCLAYHVGIDANYIGNQIMQEIYSIKSRLVPPEVQMALCIPVCQGGSNPSSVSSYFTCSVSLRDYDPFYHQKVIDHIKKATRCFCEAQGAEFAVTVSSNLYRSVENNPKAIQIIQPLMEEIYGKENVILQPKGCFAGQDFCEFSEKKPSCYIRFGTALPGSISPQTHESLFPAHSNKFKINEQSLPKAVQIWKKLAFSVQK